MHDRPGPDRAGYTRASWTVADHPYFGEKLDAYALLSFLLGRTGQIAGAVTVTVTVTSLPTRPAPVLARTITSLSALSGGRVVLGIGAGAIWDMIVKLGVPRLDGGSAVRAMEEAITLIRALSGGRDPVTFDGEFYHVSGLDPADVAAPPIWTGSVGPKSLAATGRAADGWVPPMASDWQSKLYRESRPRIDEAAATAGRDPAEIADIYNFGGRITPDRLAVTPRRGRALDRRLGPAVGRRANRRSARIPRERLHLPQHRRHSRRPGPDPLGQGDSPGRPRGDRQVRQTRLRAPSLIA